MRKFLRKLIRILLNRNTLFVVLLLLQAALLTLTILFLSQHYLPVYAVLIALDVVLVIYITNTSENPSYKIPWLVAMLVLPLFAGFAYLLVKTDVGHKTIKRECAEKMHETKKELVQDPEIQKALCDAYPDQGGLSRYITDYGGYPAYRNYISEFYPVGEAMFEAIYAQRNSAQIKDSTIRLISDRLSLRGFLIGSSESSSIAAAFVSFNCIFSPPFPFSQGAWASQRSARSLLPRVHGECPPAEVPVSVLRSAAGLSLYPAPACRCFCGAGTAA